MPRPRPQPGRAWASFVPDTMTVPMTRAAAATVAMVVLMDMASSAKQVENVELGKAGSVEPVLALMSFGGARERAGSKFFQIVDPRRAVAHFPSRSNQLAVRNRSSVPLAKPFGAFCGLTKRCRPRP